MKKVEGSILDELAGKPKAQNILDPQIEEVFNLEKNDIMLATKNGYELVKITKVLQTRYEPQFKKRTNRKGAQSVPQITPLHLMKYLESIGVETKDLVITSRHRPSKTEIARQMKIITEKKVEILKKHMDDGKAVDMLAKEYGVSPHYITKVLHAEV